MLFLYRTRTIIVKTHVAVSQSIPIRVFIGAEATVVHMQRSLSDPDYVALVATLRRARQAKRLSQLALSETLGKPQSFVAKYETCERRLDVLEVLRVCRALGIRLGDVLPGHWRDHI